MEIAARPQELYTFSYDIRQLVRYSNPVNIFEIDKISISAGVTHHLVET